MNQKKLLALTLALASLALGFTRATIAASKPTPREEPTVIPFEFVNRHILIKTRIGQSPPLSFIFDTGDKLAIVDLKRANMLGLNMQGEIAIGGAGPGTLKGSYVRGASLTVVGAEQNPQPVVLAVPLDSMKPKFGQEIDGIIGADFISHYVLEVDYSMRVLRLHDKDKFAYNGPGEVIPAKLNSAGHPVITAEITLNGRPPIKGNFVVDIGSSGSLILNRPFVEEEKLLGSIPKTIRAIGGGGAGGKTSGRVGRISELKIGNLRVDSPVTMFSEDSAGAFAASSLQGNIGAHILTKFKVFLDYSHSRMILEPGSTFKDPIIPASSGLRVVAEGDDYRTFRVDELLEESPAAESGLQTNDLILSLDERPAAQLTLTMINETFEKAAPHTLLVRRGDKNLKLTVTPRRLI